MVELHQAHPGARGAARKCLPASLQLREAPNPTIDFAGGTVPWSTTSTASVARHRRHARTPGGGQLARRRWHQRPCDASKQPPEPARARRRLAARTSREAADGLERARNNECRATATGRHLCRLPARECRRGGPARRRLDAACRTRARALPDELAGRRRGRPRQAHAQLERAQALAHRAGHGGHPSGLPAARRGRRLSRDGTPTVRRRAGLPRDPRPRPGAPAREARPRPAAVPDRRRGKTTTPWRRSWSGPRCS